MRQIGKTEVVCEMQPYQEQQQQYEVGTGLRLELPVRTDHQRPPDLLQTLRESTDGLKKNR